MKKTGTILDQIVATKKEYLEERKRGRPQNAIEQQLRTMKPYTGPGFFKVLKASQPTSKIIAEVKQASPSAGSLRDRFDLSEINDAYQISQNVVAISVITERDYFGGSEDNLAYIAAQNTNHKPLLRKDFLFEAYQIIESKLLGAQAYLLIASLFEPEELQELIKLGQSLGIEPLVEVHTQAELDMVRQTTARCIGVNSRDLKTFLVDPGALELLGELDDSYARVAESGIHSAKGFQSALEVADAALIGSHFMRAPDIPTAINELVGAAS